METMTQALLRKPRFPLLDHQRSEGSPVQDQGRPDGQGGLRGWERASNFNNFMNNSIPGYAIQGLMPGGIGLGLAARANNFVANNAYSNAMNSRTDGPILRTPQQKIATRSNNFQQGGGGEYGGGYGSGGMGDQSTGSMGGMSGW
tara:strand:+ start:202 stop:636 length:435 start_codon:yes stop_codon:yes gene_type:complete